MAHGLREMSNLPTLLVGFGTLTHFTFRSNGTNCLNLFHPTRILAFTAASASPSTLNMSPKFSSELLLLQPFYDPLSGTTRVSRYQKDKLLDFAEAETMGWQWHQLNHMQAICTLLQKKTTPAPHHSDFYRPDALPDTQPTASTVKALKFSSESDEKHNPYSAGITMLIITSSAYLRLAG